MDDVIDNHKQEIEVNYIKRLNKIVSLILLNCMRMKNSEQLNFSIGQIKEFHKQKQTF